MRLRLIPNDFNPWPPNDWRWHWYQRKHVVFDRTKTGKRLNTKPEKDAVLALDGQLEKELV